MPTPTDFRQVLRQLANHLHHLQAELYDTGLPAARQSQTGARTTTTKGRPPCDITMLDHLHTDVMPRIAGWAYNLSTDTGLTIPTTVITNGFWCAWLNRHAGTLTTMPWAQDCYDELHDLQAELQAHIHPPQPNPQYEQRQTARSIIHRLHQMGHTTITPDTLRQWAHRGKITTITINSRNGYLLSEALDAVGDSSGGRLGAKSRIG